MSRRRRRFASAIAAGTVCLVMATPAVAATDIGATFDPGTSFCGNPLLQSISPADSYAAPAPGVITSWSYQASQGPVQIQLKVGRAAGGNNWFIVGESPVATAAASSLNTFPARIPVQAGDVVGIRPVTNGLPCIRGMSPGYSYSAYVMGDDLPPGSTLTFNPPSGNVQLDVSARLEADGDGDGFGDESQDQCVGTAGPVDGCPVNAFSLGQLQRSKRRGTATLSVSVPGPGTLALTGQGLAAQAVTAASDLTLQIRASGKKRRKLNRRGKVSVTAQVTYTPTGGKPNAQGLPVKLVKRHKKRHR